MNADEAEEAKLVAATALRAHFPKIEGLDEAVPLSADKRQLDAIVSNLQVLSCACAAFRALLCVRGVNDYSLTQCGGAAVTRCARH